jgi:glycosyltransferase involved in cell wall biosynthesis
MTDYQPLISVVFASYNHEKYIGETVASIWRQPYRNIEIVIVDDCSPDGSWALLQDLQARSPLPMRVGRNSQNRGPATTLNAALKLASGELIALFSSDDLFSEDRFTRAVALFAAKPALQIVYGNGLTFTADERMERVHKPRVKALLEREPAEISRYLYTHVSPLFLQTTLMRRELIEQIGGFDPQLLADDWLLNSRIFSQLASRDQFAYLDEVMFLYRLHPHNVHRDTERQHRLKLEFVEKHTPDDLKPEAFSNIHYLLARSDLNSLKFAESWRHYRLGQQHKFQWRHARFPWSWVRRWLKAHLPGHPAKPRAPI